MPNVLNDTEVANFHTDGYHVPVPVMSAAQAAAYRERLERFEARWPQQGHMLDQGAPLLCPWIDEMTRLPSILDPLADVLGSDLLCWGVSLRLKEPRTQTFAGWHQDTAYCDIKPIVVIAAVALSDCSEAASPLRVIPGSHKGATLPHVEQFGTESLLTREQEIAAEHDTTQAVTLPMAAGEMMFFNNAICHSSGPNQTAHRRIIFLIEYVPTHASQEKPRESAMLVRGQDAFHNFDEDPRPDAEMSEAAIAAWRRKVKVQASVLYRGAKHPLRALVK